MKDIETGKEELKQSKKEYYETEPFNIFAQAKQQLIECEICKCQIKGGNSHLIRHKKTRKHINNINKKEQQQ